MATLTLPNLASEFANGQANDGTEVFANFSAIKDFIDGEVIQKDASVAFTGLVSGPASDPTSDNHLARKRYVDDLITSEIGALDLGYVDPATESADTNTFVLFSQTASGSQEPKSSSGLKYNSSSETFTATNLAGDGSGLTALDADNVSAGTLDDDRLPDSIMGKTEVAATKLDVGSDGLTFNSVDNDFLDYGNVATGLWTLNKDGDPFPALTMGAQGHTYPSLSLNNKMAFGWDSTGTGRLEVWVDGVNEGYIQLTT